MNASSAERIDKAMLDRAAKLALRGAGDVEPNPLVGCVIGRAHDGQIVTLGLGHHRKFGDAHAEIDALRSCQRAGEDPKGATVWVTLEPCAHQGKTGPCAEALIKAGVRRVVIARRDPAKHGCDSGADALQRAGVEVHSTDVSDAACRVTDPFVHRILTGQPWVIAKWAQTMDGRLGTRTGESKWISSARSRRSSHRLRARVDAIITGVGTVLADDPSLTARDVRRVRRVARRVVVDPSLRTPLGSALLASAASTPLIIACDASALAGSSGRRNAAELRDRGAVIWETPAAAGKLDLAHLLRRLASEHDASNVLIESGPRLLGSLLEADLVNEVRIYLAPIALGDEQAVPVASGRLAPSLREGRRFRLDRLRRLGDDAVLFYRRLAAADDEPKRAREDSNL